MCILLSMQRLDTQRGAEKCREELSPSSRVSITTHCWFERISVQTKTPADNKIQKATTWGLARDWNPALFHPKVSYFPFQKSDKVISTCTLIIRWEKILEGTWECCSYSLETRKNKLIGKSVGDKGENRVKAHQDRSLRQKQKLTKVNQIRFLKKHSWFPFPFLSFTPQFTAFCHLTPPHWWNIHF